MKRFILRAAMAVALVAIASTSTVVAQEAGTEYANAAAIPTAAAGEAFAVYDAATGEVFFSVGTGVQGFGIQNLGGTVITANVNADALGVGSLQQINADSVAGLTFAPAGFDPGVFSIGNALPADPSILTAVDFAAAFPGAISSANTGFDANLSVIPGAAVPEPGTLVVLTIAGVGVATRRRR